MELRHMVSNHSLQRRKLVSAGSYLRTLREETQILRTNAESLTGRVDRVLSDAVQSVIDGDNFISAIGRAFDNPPDRTVGTGDGRRSADPRPSSNPIITRPPALTGGPIPTGSPLTTDARAAAQADRPNPTFDPSPQMNEAMDREFSPRRVTETEEQYENRYNAHLRRIQNTQQSWTRPGYNIQPPVPQGQEDIPLMDMPVPQSEPTRIQAPPPGRAHPDAPCNAQYRADMISRLNEMDNHVHAPQVQFESVSRPYQHGQGSETSHEERNNYRAGPAGTSAYRVTQGPPSNGLWNAEQYHYTVLIKRIRKLVKWKVGTYISAPSGSKQPKMGEPTKYSGNRNHDVFLQWLNQFLNWLRSHYHCGDEADYSRLNFLGNYLEGAAADWFAADVDNPDRMSIEPMKFIDAICSMHRRFVRTATANNAVTQYDKVEYSTSDGVEGFYYKLDKMANRMVERPNDYSFRLRLFEGLPAWIYDTLLERNILPEFCNLEDIRENARQVEELRLRARGTFKGNPMTANPTRSSAKTRDVPHTSQAPNRAPVRPNRSSNNNRSSLERNAGRSQDRQPSSFRTGGSASRPPNASSNRQGPAGDTHAKNSSEMECYSCGERGHIASNPKCKNYKQRQNRPRLNAQRLIEEDCADEDEPATEEEPQEQTESQYANSWGGSQYDPHDEDNQDDIEYDNEDTPEGEGDDEVRMSTMRVQMHAMRRIRDANSTRTLELQISTRVSSTPALQISPNPDQGSVATESNEGVSSNSIHSHLYTDDGDGIQDPVHIEYRDGHIYRYDPDDPVDETAIANDRTVRCLMCHRCNPRMSIEYFTGQHDGQRYWYPVYLCVHPVERWRAEEDIDANEGEFDASRFFAARLVHSPEPEPVEENPTSTSYSSASRTSGSSPPFWYVDDPIGIITDPSTIRVGETIILDDQARYLLSLRDRIGCDACHNCVPRVVAIYKGTEEGTVLSHYRLACINLEGYPPDRHLIGAIGWTPDETVNHLDFIEDDATSSTDSMPELVGTPPAREEPRPNISDITESDVAEAVDGDSTNDFLSDDEEALYHDNYHRAPCAVCHSCQPRVEQSYHYCADGEVVTRERLVCQRADDTHDHPSTSDGHRLQAMRTVHSSSVRRRDPWGNEQPRRSPRLQATLAAEVTINGVKALTLFDSGSTTDSITPEFAFVTKAKQVKLEEQVILQLGCVGSRSKISYGTKVPVEIGGVKEEAYFDLVNIDRYDCIIGTPFMNAHGVCLDFGNRCILVKGQGIQAFSFDEEQKYVDKKKSLRAGRSRAPPRETAPIRKRIVAPMPSPTT
jgi:hypothetical protein